MNNVRETRHNNPLSCGHLFHANCIHSWKKKGKHTCPLCRDIIDKSKYKITVSVENTQTSNVGMVNALNAIGNVVGLFDINLDDLDIFSTDIVVEEISNSDELESILQRLGVSISDIHTLIRDTE